MADYRERMKSLREDRDLTQSELGILLNKSQQGYNHIETGRAELKIDDLITLCKFYRVTADCSSDRQVSFVIPPHGMKKHRSFQPVRKKSLHIGKTVLW